MQRCVVHVRDRIACRDRRIDRCFVKAELERLLFAGEATSADRYGYADGAMSTGIREAKRLLGAESVQLGPIDRVPRRPLFLPGARIRRESGPASLRTTPRLRVSS